MDIGSEPKKLRLIRGNSFKDWAQETVFYLTQVSEEKDCPDVIGFRVYLIGVITGVRMSLETYKKHHPSTTTPE